MSKPIHMLSAVLFAFLLMIPGQAFAHGDEHEAKKGHGSSESYEEGSDTKKHSEKYVKSSKHADEGSDTKEHSKKYEKSSKHMEEGSGMR